MRHVIWGIDDYFEKKRTSAEPDMEFDRVDMDAFGVEFSDGLPLLWNFDLASPPRGKCFDVQFSEGEISCEVAFYKDTSDAQTLLEAGDVVLGGYYKSVVMNEDKSVVLHCELSAVSMVAASHILMRRARAAR